MSEKIKNFRDLDVWTKGIEIVKDVYGITDGFPKQEFYGLASQMQRCSVSIPSNIAEGFNTFHNKEYKQFLHISLGSCAELTTQIIIASKLNYIAAKAVDAMVNEIEEISKMTMSLIKKL